MKSLWMRIIQPCAATRKNDLETSFAERLEGVDCERLKTWYNGYHFLGVALDAQPLE